MGNLVQAAEALDITKGVSVYTVTHFGLNNYDLRSSNLANNFDGGIILRADKSKIKSTNAYVYSDNGKLEKPIVYSDFIGRLYHQNDSITNASLKFVTEEGFTKFENAIREINIRDNVNDFYYNVKPEDYDTFIFGNYNPSKLPETSNLGDEYSIKGHVLHADHGFITDSNVGYADELMYYTRDVSNKTGFKGFSSQWKYEYRGLVPSNPLDANDYISTDHIDRNYTNGSGSINVGPLSFSVGTTKDITELAEILRNDYILRNYRYNFDYFEEFRKFQDLSEGLGNKRYGDLENIFEVPNLTTFLGKFGLYHSSKEDRDRLIEETGNRYTYKKEYAIGPQDESQNILEYFSVNEEVNDFVSTITKHNGGSTIGKYYREHDNGGQTPNNPQFIPEEINNSQSSSYSKLINRTNSLFYNQKIGSLINRFHTSPNSDVDNNELVTSKSKYGLSRGRNLLAEESETINGYENPYCRVWTALHQYGKINTLIRPFKGGKNTVAGAQSMYEGTGLRTESGDSTSFAKHTVLQDNGFVRISPMHNEPFYEGDKNIKSYMFSIENLAWRDVRIGETLSKEQQGPNKGRIMWFPPYNLKFTENINVDWNANKFIGRGEQIYTYTNTDRSGTLSFTLLIDHPSIINKWRGRGDIDESETDYRENQILRFFAGCSPLTGYCGNGVDTPTDTPPNDTPNNPQLVGRTKKVALVLFFPNNFSAYDYGDNIDSALQELSKYEKGTSGQWTAQDRDIENRVDGNDNGEYRNLNYSPNDTDKSEIRRMLFDNDENIEIISFFNTNSGYTKLNQLIETNGSSGATIFGEGGENIEIDKIEAKGCASSHGNYNNNMILCERRKNFIKDVISQKCNSVEISQFTDLNGQEIPVGNNREINSLNAKIARCAYVIFNIKWDETTTPSETQIGSNTYSVNNQNYSNATVNSSGTTNNVASLTSTENFDEYTCDNEYLYFSKLEETKDIAYQKIVERIRYFNPAYHSVTPEGFNSRLTFLQQCTRQGPTMDLSSGNISATSSNYLKYAGNLSFGRAPYCVLRIGDFFHTKICITSMSIDYDNNGGVQWDLNPEGAGVQPMYANINITFNFIGGQDIAGPIERLQNAITSNYYANASIYDKKADSKGSRKYNPRMN